MATTSSTMLTGKRMPRWLAGVTAGALVLLGAPVVGMAPAAADNNLGPFEIDANLVLDGGSDWFSFSSAGDQGLITLDDNTSLSGQDPTAFKGASKEYNVLGTSGAWPTWEYGGGEVPGKSDFGRIALWTKAVGSTVYTYVGFDRGSGTGTSKFAFELNQVKQANPLNANPTRSQGDIRFIIWDQGNGKITLEGDENNTDVGMYVWDDPDVPNTPPAQSHSDFPPGPVDTAPLGEWVKIDPPSASFLGAANSDGDNKTDDSVKVPSWWTSSNTYIDDNGTKNDESDDFVAVGEDQFVEFGFDLGSFGALLGCPSQGYSAANLRSITGTGGPGTLMDYMEAQSVNIPSQCSSITVNKYRAGTTTLVPGASFTFTPNPIPGSNTPSVTIADGSANDADGAVNGTVVVNPAKPGSYTITEAAAPAGYILIPTASEQVTAVALQTPPAVSFYNPLGAIRWLKTYGEGDTPNAGATFSVDRTSGGGDFTTITGFSEPFTVVDNGAKDEDDTMGEIQVSGLPVGSYTITETAAPVGYGIDPNPTATVTIPGTADSIAAAQEPRTASRTFANPRLTGSLTVEKLGQPGDVPVQGATFALWKVVGDPDITSDETDDVRLADKEPITTGADGTATVSGLAWGAFYYFEELSAPSPWNLPDYRYTDVEGLSAADATNNVVTVLTIDDPRSAIETTATPVAKLPGAPIKDQATLSGIREDAGGTITFTLYGPYDADADATCNVEDALVLAPVTVNGPGQYDSPEVTPTVAGRYFWIASYSGDPSTNTWPVSGECGDANETTLVEKATPGISTIAGGKDLVQGKSYLPEAKIYDVATVTGLTYDATGTVTFRVFLPGDTTCSVTDLSRTFVVPLPAPVNGPGGYSAVVTSPDYTATAAGLYRWTAEYSGDDNNAGDAEACNAPNENWNVEKAVTTITTDTRTAEDQDTKLPGTSLVDTATLTGLTANAGGTVTFQLFDETCTTEIWSDTQNVVGPHPSGTVTITSDAYTGTLDAGTYAWLATYTGDANNEGATHECGSTEGGNYEIHVIDPADPTIVTTATDATLAAGDGVTTISDTAVLDGLTENATGEVTFTVYGPFEPGEDIVCSAGTEAGTATESFDGADGGTVEVTATIEVGDAGIYAWYASYGGDDNNNPVDHECGSTEGGNDEISEVDPRQPQITTTATALVTLGVEEGASGTITDSASLTGLTGDAEGTVTFRVYGPVAPAENGSEPDAVCEVQFGDDIVVALGDIDAQGNATVTIPEADQVTVTEPGYYFWVAEYTSTTGDNLGVAGECGDEGETSLVTQADPGISKVVKDAEGNELTPSFPDAVEVGDVLTYEVTVTNAGTADATDDVTDVLPEFVAYVDGSADNGGDYDPDTHVITWTEVTVAGGGSLTLTYDVTVLDGAATEGNDILINKASWFELEASTETWVKWIEVMAAPRCVADTPVLDYEVVTHNLDPLAEPPYTVDFQFRYAVDDPEQGISAGDPVPTGVTTIDGVPQALTDLPLTGTLLYPGAKTDGGVTIDWPGWVNEGTIDAPVWKQVGDGLTPSVVLFGSVNPTDESQVLYPPATSGCFAPPGVPSLDKNSPTEQGSELNETGIESPGDTIRYNITLVNNGGTTVTSDLVDTLPAGVEDPRNFTPAAPTTISGQTLTWAEVTLEPGEQVTYSFDVTVGLDQVDGAVLENDATWAGMSDQTIHRVVVEPTPNAIPELDKDSDPAPGSTVKAGDVITYTIKLGNDGDAPATGDLVDTLPAGIEVVGNFTKNGAASEPDSVTATTITWNDVTVVPGETVTFTYDVKVLDSNADGAKLVNTARWLGLQDATTHTVVVDAPVIVPDLPKTGAEVLQLLLWAGLLLAAGAMFVAFGRRREADQG